MIFFISAESKQRTTCLPQCEERSGLGNVLVEEDNPHYTRKMSSSSRYCGLVEHNTIADNLPIYQYFIHRKNL